MQYNFYILHNITLLSAAGLIVLCNHNRALDPPYTKSDKYELIVTSEFLFAIICKSKN